MKLTAGVEAMKGHEGRGPYLGVVLVLDVGGCLRMRSLSEEEKSEGVERR